MRKRILARVMVLTAALALAACGVMDKVAPGRSKIDYREAQAIDSLEVPPELSSSTINDAPDSLDVAATTFSGQGDTTGSASRSVLPVSSAISLQRDGDQQWLLVQAPADRVWPRVREFWAQEGFLVELEDPAIGIMETSWAENRADIPQGIIRNAFGKVLDSAYSAATRDKYRVRFEHGTAGTTEIYLTHRGVQEVVKGGAVDNSTFWEPRPADPELEAEMLKRLMVYLGLEQRKAESMLAQQAATPVRAHLVSDAGGSMLVIDEDYSSAWRRTGVALDRIGFVVMDRDRSAGTYFVTYTDPLAEQDEQGLLSKLAFWSSDDEMPATEYRVQLLAEDAVTHVVVNNAQGQRDTTSTAKRILTLLEEQLR